MELTPQEAERLPHVLNDDGEPILPQREDGSCSLLRDEKCSVYEKRPRACQRYDCRISCMAGIIGTNLIDAGYVPFGIYAKTQEEVDMLTALRMAAMDAVATASGHGGSPEMNAAMRRAESLVPAVAFRGACPEKVAAMALALWPKHMEKAKELRQIFAADPTLKAKVERFARSHTTARGAP